MEDIRAASRASRAQGVSGKPVSEAVAERKSSAWPSAVLAGVLTALLFAACSPAPNVSDDKTDQGSLSLGSG